MKDIVVGIIIILAIFLIGDFIYSEKNTCVRNEPVHVGEVTKCGLVKEKWDINIHFLERYW